MNTQNRFALLGALMVIASPPTHVKEVRYGGREINAGPQRRRFAGISEGLRGYLFGGGWGGMGFDARACKSVTIDRVEYQPNRPLGHKRRMRQRMRRQRMRQ